MTCFSGDLSISRLTEGLVIQAGQGPFAKAARVPARYTGCQRRNLAIPLGEFGPQMIDYDKQGPRRGAGIATASGDRLVGAE